MNCTGERCIMQHDKINPATCKCVSYCPQATLPKTNADHVRAMSDEELVEWYWWMLHYVQGYTDSRVALHEWLKQDYITFVTQEYKKDLNDRLNREGISP